MREMIREKLGEPREFQGNQATAWGEHNEEGALLEYRMETLYEVTEVGFVEHEDWAGVSPDGLVEGKGLVEIKAPYSLKDADAPVPFKGIDAYPHYFDQIQFQLFVTGREWCHWFQWAPKGIYLRTIHPDPDWVADNIPRLRK